MKRRSSSSPARSFTSSELKPAFAWQQGGKISFQRENIDLNSPLDRNSFGHMLMEYFGVTVFLVKSSVKIHSRCRWPCFDCGWALSQRALRDSALRGLVYALCARPCEIIHCDHGADYFLLPFASSVLVCQKFQRVPPISSSFSFSSSSSSSSSHTLTSSSRPL